MKVEVSNIPFRNSDGSESTALQDEKLIRVFPNPANDFMKILFPASAAKTQINLFDVTGKNLMRGKIATTETVINISDLATSTYFLNMVESGKVVKTFKIIKNN